MKRLLLLLLALIALAATAAPASQAAAKPNLVFILADDLGYGDVGCYGQKRILTPNIDRLAAEGMRFTQFYAGSTVCAPSRCVLMTGLHTGHCYIRGNAKTNLRPEDVTVAEVLKAAGYRTGLIGKWGLGHEGSTGVPTRQGFDSFFGYLDQTHAHNYYPTFLLRNEQRVPLRNVVPNEGPVGQGIASVRVDYSHDLMAEEALRFLDQQKDGQPFFLYLAFTLPHANNEAGKQGLEVPDLGDYANQDWPASQKAHAAMVSRLDRDVGRVMERLRALGMDRNTLVIFTSDNGPHREGGHDPELSDSNGPLRGIKRALYEGGIRVPMLARWPGRIKPGSTANFMGYFGDVLPTAAELAGAKEPAGLDGVGFLPTLLGSGEQRQHAYLYWEFYEQGGRQAVRMGDWKAIRQPWGGRIELYDLKADLGETHDLAADHPDVVEKLRPAMDEAHVPSPLWTVRGGANDQ
jgi:arylsulfatase A-like enzyme